MLFVFLLFAWSLVLIRGAFLQLTPNDRLVRAASKQYKTTVALEARRGAILDRYGKDLAISETSFSLFADPQVLALPRKQGRQLSSEIKLNYRQLQEKVKDKSKRFVWLERQLGLQQKKKIESLKIKGLGFIEEAKRVYPNDEILGPILGFVGREGQGLEGLELAFD